MPGGKRFPGWRWASIALRTLHLAGVVGAAVGILGEGTPHAAGIALMLASGAALYALDLWQHRGLWREVAGLFVPVKLALLAAMLLLPGAAVAIFWVLLIASSLVSHAPHGFRHRRILR